MVLIPLGGKVANGTNDSLIALCGKYGAGQFANNFLIE